MPDEVLINGSATTDVNLNDTTPAASPGRALMLWQSSGASPTSASVQTPASIPVVLDREMTDLTITNNTTEQTIFSHSVPANAMGTNRSLRLVLIMSIATVTTASDYTLRVKFGGTTIFQDTTGSHVADVDARAIYLDLWLVNQDATNDQTGGGAMYSDAVGTMTPPTTGIAGDIANLSIDGSPIVFANSALDTTVAQTFEVTWQMNTGGASNSYTRRMAILTLV